MDVLNLFMFPVAFLERIIRTIRNVDPCIRLKDYQQHKYCELHRNLVSHSSIASIQGLQTKTCDQWICFQSSVHSMEVFPPRVFQDWSFAWDSTLKILKWLAKAPMTRYCESGLARSSCLCTHCRPKSQAHVKLKVFFQGCKMNWTAPSLGVIDWTPHSAQEDKLLVVAAWQKWLAPAWLEPGKQCFTSNFMWCGSRGGQWPHFVGNASFGTGIRSWLRDSTHQLFWVDLRYRISTFGSFWQDSSFMVLSIQMSSRLRKLCFSIHFNSIYWPEQYFRENSSRLGMDPWCFRFLRQDVVFVYSFAKERCPRLVAVQDRTWWLIHNDSHRSMVSEQSSSVLRWWFVANDSFIGEKKARVMQGLRINLTEGSLVHDSDAALLDPL